ncbi:sugar phosphate isomerase/epimerase family protein [Lacticaseibacillus camelliae]|nr:sugar phosphate isomerase/epimerase [Lacticaseibacillus camelliae]
MADFTITGFADEIGPDLDEQIRVLHENGISHIEVRGIDGENVSEFTLAEAKGYKKRLDDAGIKVSSIGSPIGKIEITDAFEPHLEQFKHVLEVARVFNAQYVRVFSFFMADSDTAKYQDEVIRRWQAFMEAAKDYPEITLLHENEKAIFGDVPERCLTLLKSIDSPQLRAAFDPANFVQCGVKVYPEAFDLLAPYIAYIHIKDAHYADRAVTPAGYGDGKLKDILARLVKDNYHGYLSLEPHLTEFTGFAQLEQDGVSIADNEVDDGARAFTVASNALKAILVDQLHQEWK